VFDGIYRKLERELHEKKNKMAQIIEVSNAAYEARDRAQAEMISLKEQADKEQTKFEVEWSQLGQLIEKDRKMKDFIKSRERERLTLKSSDPAFEEEQKLRNRVTYKNLGIQKDKANIHLSMEKVQSYEEAFAKIQKATKITDIDELVQTFINAEDHNFSLFNYVNDLSNEIEQLEDSISEVKKEIEKYKGQGVSADNQRKRIISDLASKLSKTEEKADFYESKYANARATIDSLKEGIGSIFEKIGCNDEVLKETLNNAGVTETNMMQYLGIIEDRTNELLVLYNQQQAKNKPSDEGYGDGNQAEDGLSIAAPTTQQYSDEDSEGEEEDERPLTEEELNARRSEFTEQGTN
jgi:uncharacterized phage infection (PIP) family protein YhgE